MLPVLRRRNETPASYWGIGTDFDRIFDSAFGGPLSRAGWNPAVDVSETDEAYVVTAELAGLTAKDVEITVDHGVLTLTGEKRDESEQTESSGRRLMERRYGRFQRHFSLPRTVDTENVQARFENGLLTITLPKAEAAKPRRIKIK